MLNCSVRLGHLLTWADLDGAERLAVHHAAAGLERAELGVADQLGDFLGQADDVLAAPADGGRAAKLSNSGASGVPSVARAARLFLTTTTWMFLPRSSARSRVLVLASKPTIFTNRAS